MFVSSARPFVLAVLLVAAAGLVWPPAANAGLMDALGDAVSGVKDTVADTASALAEKAKGVYSSVKDGLSTAIGTIAGVAGSIGDPTAMGIGAAVGGVVAGPLGAVGGALLGSSVGNAIKSGISSVADYIKGSAGDFKAFQTLTESIKGGNLAGEQFKGFDALAKLAEEGKDDLTHPVLSRLENARDKTEKAGLKSSAGAAAPDFSKLVSSLSGKSAASASGNTTDPTLSPIEVSRKIDKILGVNPMRPWNPLEQLFQNAAHTANPAERSTSAKAPDNDLDGLPRGTVLAAAGSGDTSGPAGPRMTGAFLRSYLRSQGHEPASRGPGGAGAQGGRYLRFLNRGKPGSNGAGGEESGSAAGDGRKASGSRDDLKSAQQAFGGRTEDASSDPSRRSASLLALADNAPGKGPRGPVGRMFQDDGSGKPMMVFGRDHSKLAGGAFFSAAPNGGDFQGYLRMTLGPVKAGSGTLVIPSALAQLGLDGPEALSPTDRPKRLFGI